MVSTKRGREWKWRNVDRAPVMSLASRYSAPGKDVSISGKPSNHISMNDSAGCTRYPAPL